MLSCDSMMVQLMPRGSGQPERPLPTLWRDSVLPRGAMALWPHPPLGSQGRPAQGHALVFSPCQQLPISVSTWAIPWKGRCPQLLITLLFKLKVPKTTPLASALPVLPVFSACL